MLKPGSRLLVVVAIFVRLVVDIAMPSPLTFSVIDVNGTALDTWRMDYP